MSKMRDLIALGVIAWSALVGCQSSSEFEGSTVSATEDDGKYDSNATRDDAAYNGSSSGGQVIERGIFTLRAVPPNPQPGQSYDILIDVKPAPSFGLLRTAEVEAVVDGSDDFFRRITWPARPLDTRSGPAGLKIHIPGAHNGVRDTITLSAPRLGAYESIDLNFLWRNGDAGQAYNSSYALTAKP